MLHRPDWEPSEPVGRIKVVLAEGVVQQDSPSNFDKLRDVVHFAFQHAPLSW
jgi:hypothetical protein